MGKELSDEQHRILREKGTERPFTGKYHDHYDEGVYRCAGCGQVLFDSEHKYDSGTGWPSFWDAVGELDSKLDFELVMPRTEVLCKECGGHLGHVFKDDTQPSGKSYCINSAALEFESR